MTRGFIVRDTAGLSILTTTGRAEMYFETAAEALAYYHEWREWKPEAELEILELMEVSVQELEGLVQNWCDSHHHRGGGQA